MAGRIRTNYTNNEVSEVARALKEVSTDARMSYMPLLTPKQIDTSSDAIEPFSTCLLNSSTATLPNDATLNPGTVVCVYSNNGCTLNGGGKLIRGAATLAVSVTAIFLIYDGEAWH